MAKFKIEITETLQKQLIVEAKTLEEALEKVNKAYDNGKIELNCDNFVNKKIGYTPGLEGEKYIEKFQDEQEWEKYENGWFCIDSDNDQYCRKINDTTFDFAELNFAKDWVRETIRLENYTDDEIEEFLKPYGFIEEVENQIIAECIFETEFMGY